MAAGLVLVALTFLFVRLIRTGFTGVGNPNLPASVQGTHWRLTSIVAAGSTLTPTSAGGVPATLLLSRHGFAITGDCNDESGPLSISGTKLTFRVDRGSLVACGTSPVHTLLAALVRGPAYYTTAPGTLTLQSHQAKFTFSK
jgi:heat shock protein HslJ